MEKTLKVAEAIAKRMDANRFDPAMILVIIGLIADAIKMWRSCQETSPSTIAKNHGIVFRMRMRRAAKERLHEQNLSATLAPDIAAAALEQLATMTDDEVREIAKEVRS